MIWPALVPIYKIVIIIDYPNRMSTILKYSQWKASLKIINCISIKFSILLCMVTESVSHCYSYELFIQGSLNNSLNEVLSTVRNARISFSLKFQSSSSSSSGDWSESLERDNRDFFLPEKWSKSWKNWLTERSLLLLVLKDNTYL